MSASNDVQLVCVKEGKKLRIKIVSSGYYTDANCMFPRDLRIEGRRYTVQPSDITLVTSRGKYFYSIKKTNIKIVEEQPSHIERIYEDTTSQECIICLDNNKEVIVDPCGHFYMCRGCSKSINNCPLCRGPIRGLIDRTMMEA